MNRQLLRALILMNVAAAAYLGASPAAGHSEVDTYLAGQWALNDNVHYKIDNNVPAAWRPDINDGADHWSNRADGRAPNFVYEGTATLTHPYTPCGGANAVYSRDIGQDVADGLLPPAGRRANGATITCSTEDPGTLTGFTMVIDNHPEDNTPGVPNAGWFLGDGAIPPNAWDLEGTATHEFGHVTGFVPHWTDTSNLCTNADPHTMCGAEPGFRGSKARRTLETHDIHTLEDAYTPPPCPPVCKER